MDEATLLRASERERTLYAELGEAYRTLAAAVSDDAGPVDPAAVAAHARRVDTTVDALRTVSAAVAAQRLSGAAVAAEVQSLWRESSRLAADALEANRRLVEVSRARQAALAERLTRLDQGRRALTGYRGAARPERGTRHV